MTPFLSRRFSARAISLLVVSALALAACSSSVLAAATVNGFKIDRSDFQRELEALRANKAFYDQLQQAPSDASDDDTVPAAFAASWLTQVINVRLIEEEFEHRDLKLTAELKKGATSQLAQQFGGDAVWKKFPKWFRDLMVERFGKVAAVEKAIYRYPTEPAKAEAYFNEHASDFDQFCAKHILVKTEEQAAEIVGLLRAGGDFAALAKDRSTDTGSGAAGGELGCASKDTYVEPFAKALAELEVNTVSDPVKSEFGYHVIVVTERKPVKWEADQAAILEALGRRNDVAARAFLTKAIKDAEVDVDPRYGTLEKAEGQIQVVPPKEETPPDRRQDTTTTSGAGESSSGATGVTAPTVG